MKRRAWFSAAVFAVLVIPLGACSSSGSGGGGGGSSGCNEDPWSCPAGQTCTFGDAEGSSFVCLDSGPGQDGEACQNVAGSATCGDGLLCLQQAGATMGVCTAFCDPTTTAHACADAAACVLVATPSGNDLHVCQPASSASGSSSSGTGTGGATGAGGSGG